MRRVRPASAAQPPARRDSIAAVVAHRANARRRDRPRRAERRRHLAHAAEPSPRRPISGGRRLSTTCGSTRCRKPRRPSCRRRHHRPSRPRADAVPGRPRRRRAHDHHDRRQNLPRHNPRRRPPQRPRRPRHRCRRRVAQQASAAAKRRHRSSRAFPPSTSATPHKLRKGQFVIAIGNPFAIATDGQPTASWGIVTNLARKAPPAPTSTTRPAHYSDYRTTLHHLGTLIQTDAKLGWSAGGGALVNLRGELVGLTTTAAVNRRARATGRLRDSDERHFPPHHRHAQRRPRSRVRHARHRLRPMPHAPPIEQIAPPAAASTQVYPGSPAARAGLASGRRRHARRRASRCMTSTTCNWPSARCRRRRRRRSTTNATAGRDSASEARKAGRGRKNDRHRAARQLARHPRRLRHGARGASACSKRLQSSAYRSSKAACWSTEVEPDSDAWQRRRTHGHVHQPRWPASV